MVWVMVRVMVMDESLLVWFGLWLWMRVCLCGMGYG